MHVRIICMNESANIPNVYKSTTVHVDDLRHFSQLVHMHHLWLTQAHLPIINFLSIAIEKHFKKVF